MFLPVQPLEVTMFLILTWLLFRNDLWLYVNGGLKMQVTSRVGEVLKIWDSRIETLHIFTVNFEELLYLILLLRHEHPNQYLCMIEHSWERLSITFIFFLCFGRLFVLRKCKCTGDIFTDKSSVSSMVLHGSLTILEKNYKRVEAFLCALLNMHLKLITLGV